MVDGGSDWPDETDESAFLADAAARGEAPTPVAAAAAVPVAGEKLPSLDEVVARVPAPVRALLDDLFRAKFTMVRRYPAETPPSERPGPN